MDRDLISREFMKNDMDVTKKVLQKIIKYWPVFAGILLIIIGLGIFQVLRPDIELDEPSGRTTSTINMGNIRLSAFGGGVLIAAEEVQVGFEYGGVVEEILVETGDIVQQGDILAELYDAALQDDLVDKETALRELTSDASVAAAALDLAEAQKDVLTAESTLSFYLSPYVYQAELRLQEAQDELMHVVKDAGENSSDEAAQRVAEAQQVVDHAALSLALNWETYYEEYVPDFFNFPWRDKFGFRHDYYDPPSALELAEAWAELAAAEARVGEAELYLAALVEIAIPENAYGSKIIKLENAAADLADAMDKLEAARLQAPMDGMVMAINLTEEGTIGTKKIIKIAQLDPPTLEASFDEGDWFLVQEGSRVEVIFDALPEKLYQGEITFVDPSLQTNKFTTFVSALVELDLTGTDWPGYPLSSAATIEVITAETENAVLLPLESLQEDSGSQGVVLIESGSEFLPREVELGLRDVLFVEVISGLTAGEVVLIGDFD